MPTLTPEQVYDLAWRALRHHQCDDNAAHAMALSIRATEEMGISSHGLMYLPVYCQHLACGKVNAKAMPKVSSQTPSSIRVDADCGFAHPAIDLGFAQLVPAAKQNGIAALSIHRSYNCGVLGYHVERLAKQQLLGLGFTNAPASIAPVGGSTPVVGTNPIALAVPDLNTGEAAFILDQSASVVAKSEIVKHARAGQPIPNHWAFNAQGQPTSDAEAALKGSMAPVGGYKGFGLGLLVEVFAAVLSGATLGKDASPFAGDQGGPPATGQFFIAIAPDYFSGGCYQSNLLNLCQAIATQEQARLPGQRRQDFRTRLHRAEESIVISDALMESINALLP